MNFYKVFFVLLMTAFWSGVYYLLWLTFGMKYQEVNVVHDGRSIIDRYVCTKIPSVSYEFDSSAYYEKEENYKTLYPKNWLGGDERLAYQRLVEGESKKIELKTGALLTFVPAGMKFRIREIIRYSSTFKSAGYYVVAEFTLVDGKSQLIDIDYLFEFDNDAAWGEKIIDAILVDDWSSFCDQEVLPVSLL